MIRTLAIGAGLAAELYCLLLLSLFLAQRALIYPAPPVSEAPAGFATV